MPKLSKNIALPARVVAAVRTEFDDVSSVSFQRVGQGFMLFVKRRGQDERVITFDDVELIKTDVTADELIANIINALA